MSGTDQQAGRDRGEQALVTDGPHTTTANRTQRVPGLRGHRAQLWARPLHGKVSMVGALVVSMVSHVVLLTAWWSGRPAPVVRLSTEAATPAHSAVHVEHTIVHIAQLPPPKQHTIIDDPPADPDIDPVVSLTPEPEAAEPIPDLAWFDTDEDDTAAFTIRARRPKPEAPATTLPATTEPKTLAAAQDPPPAAPATSTEAPTDTTPSQASAEVIEPRPASDNRPPRYPGAARRRGWGGRVVMHVRVDATGTPLSVEVTQSSGRALLDQAAQEAVQSWTFEPARNGPHPVAGETDVSVRFELGT